MSDALPSPASQMMFGKAPFHLPFADHRFVGGGDARGEAAGAADLRVRPGTL